MIRRTILAALLVVLVPALALAALWGALALWFRLPGPEIVRAVVAIAFAVLSLATIVLLFGRRRRVVLAAWAAVFAVLLGWWSTIEPPREADWAPEVARQVTGTIDGDILTLDNVRAFDWVSGTDATARWERRTYDLAALSSVDILLSYWGAPYMAHFMVSFGFGPDEYLVWSIEVRRTVGGVFSPVADLFKADALVIVAADERDVVRVRSNFRGEDVQIYRLRAGPEAARILLTEYVLDANALAAEPEFYNSLTTNCTTTVVKMIRAVGDRIPFDWRLIANGYLPGYLYDRGAVDTSVPLAALIEAAHIRDRALAAGDAADFSVRIREGVPKPPLRGGDGITPPTSAAPVPAPGR
jgi:hypothetical protein